MLSNVVIFKTNNKVNILGGGCFMNYMPVFMIEKLSDDFKKTILNYEDTLRESQDIEEIRKSATDIMETLKASMIKEQQIEKGFCASLHKWLVDKEIINERQLNEVLYNAKVITYNLFTSIVTEFADRYN